MTLKPPQPDAGLAALAQSRVLELAVMVKEVGIYSLYRKWTEFDV